MAERPYLSIITVNLNNRLGLEKTIISVINHTLTDYEFLIFDGGSTDGSMEVIAAYAHRLNYWVSEPDRGIYHAMNKGIGQATGEYCLFLNSGDWLVDEHVLTSIFVNVHTADILVGDCNISENGTVVFVAKPSAKLTLKSFVRNTIPHQSTFIKRDLFARFGLYDESYKLHADYDFWLRTIIIGQCSVEKLNRTVADYNTAGLSSDVTNNPDIHREATEILTGYFPPTVLDDYHHWLHEETNELTVLRWVQRQPYLYKLIEFIYKIAKTVGKLPVDKR